MIDLVCQLYGRLLYGRLDRLVIYAQDSVAAKPNRLIVIGRPGIRVGNLELGNLIYFDSEM